MSSSIPFAPRGPGYNPGTRISELYLRQGEDQAAAAQRSGQIWGGAVQGLGRIASGAVEDYGARQEQKRATEALTKRDKAFLDLYTASEGNPPPESLIKIYGPKDGLVMAKGISEIANLKGKHGQEALKGLPDIVSAVGKLGEPLRAEAWKTLLRPAAIQAGLGTPETLPADLTPELWGQIKGMGEKQRELMNVGGGNVFDPNTNQFITAPPKPVEPAKPGTFESFVVGKFGPTPTPEQQITARKEWEAANDRPADPIAQELGRMRLEEGRAKAQNGQASRKALEAVPAERRVAIDRVTNSMTKDKGAKWRQTLSSLAADGDEEGLKSSMMQAATESEPVNVRTQVQGRQQMVGLLGDALGTIKDMKARGIPTNIFAGGLEDGLRKLGTSSNPEYVALANQLAGTLITYRKAATGAAFSDKESAQYEKMFPNYRNTLPVNEALIEGLMREADTNSRTYWNSKVGSKAADWLIGSKPVKASATPKAGQKDSLGIR